MKKLLAICLAVLLICAAMPFAFATASEEPTIVVSDVEGKAGDTVSVTIDLKNNPGLVSAVTKVGYDAGALELLEVAAGDFNAKGYSFGPKTKNPYTINFCDAIAEADYTEELFATLTFKIKDDAAPGVYPFTLECDYEGDFYNLKWGVIEFAEQVGAVTVISDEPAVEPELPVAGNLIVNGTFENGNTDGWTPDRDTVASTDAAKNGAYGVMVQGPGDWGGLLSQTIAVESGKDYTLSFWVKAVKNGLNVQVKEDSWQGDTIEGAGAGYYNNTEWRYVENTFVATSDVLYINVCGSGILSTDCVYFDSFTLVCVSGGDPVVYEPLAPGASLEISPETVAGTKITGWEGASLVGGASIGLKEIDGVYYLEILRDCTENTEFSLAIDNKGYIGDNKYLVVYADFSNTEFRKASFGFKTPYGVYCTDNADGAYSPFYYLADGAAEWVTMNHGDDGCFGDAQGSEVMGKKGYFAFPVEDFLKGGKSIADDTVITGVYFYYSLSKNIDCTNVPFYFTDLKVVEELPTPEIPGEPVEPSFDGFIVNGDFETGDLTGWYEGYDSAITDAVAHGGKYSVYSTHTAKKYDLMLRQDGIAVKPNTNYNLTFWYYYDGAKADPSFYAYVKNDSENIKSITTKFTATKTWAKVSLDFNSGDYSEIYVLLQNRTENDGGVYYFDDFKIVEVKDPSFDGYITNGDFETGNLNGWENLWDSCTYDFVEGYEGGNAISITAGSWSQIRQNGIAVEPNTDYILTAWVKNANNFGLIIKAGDDSGDIASTFIESCGDWTQYSVKFNSGDQTAVCALLIGWDGGGSAIVDNVSLAKDDTPVEPPVITEPTIVIPNIEAAAGDTITVPILLKNNPGLVSAVIKVGYDASALELIEAVAGDFNAKGYSFGPKTKNPFTINFCDAIADADYTDELFATLTFKVKDDAVGGSYAFTLTCDYEGDFYNLSWHVIEFAEQAGAVTVLVCDHQYDGPCDPDCGICGEIRDIHNGLVHFDAVDSGCHYIGNIEYWYCPDCECFWADEALTQLTNSKNVIIPAKGGETIHFEAIEPGCHYNGRIEYWYCAECDQYWQDEALTQITNSKNVILPYVGSDNLQHVEAVAPTCQSEGNIEYWYCPDCEQFWADEALTQITNSKSVILGILDHNIVHMDAVDPGCHYIGNIEYWFCSECGSHWADEALTLVTNSHSVLLPAVGGETIHFEAIEPGCHYNGRIEYWYCAECDQYWQDEALTQITNSKNVILPYVGSDNLQHVEAVAPTCQSEGNIEYWYCPDCEQYWADEALTQLTNSKNVILGVADHTIVHFDAVDAGCHYIGNIEYWFCSVCEGFWADEALTQVTNSKNIIVPMKGGETIHYEAVEPGCHYNGNIEYWYCAECNQFWQDEALTQITNSKNIIVPAVGSENLQHVEAKDPTCLEAGNIEYWFCSDCEQYWQDEALTQLTNIKNVKIAPLAHNIVHMDAVESGCHYIGNTEYWYCADCGSFWADEALTQVTNAKNVIVPAKGGETIHFEAIEPGCHYEGRIEYWYCAECNQFWQDEALTQITNSKNVILPATGSDKLVHVEAKEPTATENGNIEHWYCSECEQFWQDEALTQLTNSKNVIIGATGTVEPDSPVTGDSLVAVVVAVLALIASGVAVVLLKNKKRA